MTSKSPALTVAGRFTLWDVLDTASIVSVTDSTCGNDASEQTGNKNKASINTIDLERFFILLSPHCVRNTEHVCIRNRVRDI
jgi:hypothetical protein